MAVPDRTEPAGRGGPGPEPESPGWYRDPNRADLLRYWDGSTWTAKRRPRPAWTSGRTDLGARGLIAGEGAAVTEPRDNPPSGPPPDHDSGHEGDRPRGKRSRRRWLILAAAAVAGATAVGLAGETMRPKGPGPRVLTDAGFVKSANNECAKTLPDLRPADTGPFGQAISPVQAAAQIDRVAGGVDRLADRLRALPASAADRPHVNTWLDGWHRYTGLGRQYAVFLRRHGNANAGSLIAEGAQEAKTADDFALANGLGSCEFFATPAPDPANGF